MLESAEVWAQQRSPNSAPDTHAEGRSEVMLRTPNIAMTCLWCAQHEQNGAANEEHAIMSTRHVDHHETELSLEAP